MPLTRERRLILYIYITSHQCPARARSRHRAGDDIAFVIKARLAAGVNSLLSVFFFLIRYKIYVRSIHQENEKVYIWRCKIRRKKYHIHLLYMHTSRQRKGRGVVSRGRGQRAIGRPLDSMATTACVSNGQRE